MPSRIVQDLRVGRMVGGFDRHGDICNLFESVFPYRIPLQ
jgi:hypothetical protein